MNSANISELFFAEFFFAEAGAGRHRDVGRDGVDAAGDESVDVVRIVDGPDVGTHPERIALGNIFRVPGEDALVVVDAVDALPGQLGGGELAVEVLADELRGLGGDLFAHVEAEGDEDDARRVEEAVGLQAFEAALDEAVFARGVRVGLELQDQHGRLALRALGEVVIQRRNGLPVLETDSGKVGIGVVPDQDSVAGVVVVHDDDIVRREVDVELAAPEAGFLGHPQRGDGVPGEPGFFTVPVAPVGDNGGLSVLADRRESAVRCGLRAPAGNERCEGRGKHHYFLHTTKIIRKNL